MPRLTPYQADFSAGELSPKLWGRIDLDQYYSGASELLNFTVLPYGPITRRSGTRFVTRAPESTAIRLIPFIYSVNQSVVIELTDNKARFFYRGGLILNGNTPYEIETPWAGDLLADLRFAQSGDTMYFVCGSQKPIKLSRYGWTDWRFEEITFTLQPADWEENNWPRQVCFFDQRLVLASTPKQPQTIWCSRVGSFNDFTMETRVTVGSTTETEVLDTDAIEYTISSDDVNEICWLQPLEILAVGTAGAEYKVASSALNEALTPNNFRITKQTNYGAANISSKSLGTGTVFVQRASNRIRLYDYQYLENQWAATNITVFADHIAVSGAKDIAVQTSKDMYLWVVMGDGTLACFTYEKQQKVNAWHRHVIAGAKVLSLTVIPGDDSDQVWLAVERTIGGEKAVYIEVMDHPFPEATAPEDAVFLDSHLLYEGDKTSKLSGLSHLEGETVSVLVDGWVHPDVEVENGTIELQKPGSKICAGLKFVSRFVSLEVQAQQNITKGLNKRLVEAEVTLYKSLGLRSGIIPGEVTDFENCTTDTVYFGPTRRMDAAQWLFTGVYKISLTGSTTYDQRLVLENSLPLPTTICGIKYAMEVNG